MLRELLHHEHTAHVEASCVIKLERLRPNNKHAGIVAGRYLSDDDCEHSIAVAMGWSNVSYANITTREPAAADPLTSWPWELFAPPAPPAIAAPSTCPHLQARVACFQAAHSATDV